MTDRRPVKRMRAVLDSRTGLGISWLDVKLGVRMLGKEPLLTAVAILTLATGIPTSLTPAHMLSIFDSTFPVDEGDRIVGIRNWDTEDNNATVRSLHDFDIWRNELSSFDQVAAARSDPWNVHSPDGKAEEVRGAEVSASTFAMLRVPPLLGRYLIDADESIDAPRVVVIGEGIWASRFGRDPDIIGKQIGIGRTPHTVVGVMPLQLLHRGGDSQPGGLVGRDPLSAERVLCEPPQFRIPDDRRATARGRVGLSGQRRCGPSWIGLRRTARTGLFERTFPSHSPGVLSQTFGAARMPATL